MKDEQTYIYGYLEQSDTALCPFCTQAVYGKGLLLALGKGMIEAIRYEYAKLLSETLHCCKCGQAILTPVSAELFRFDAFRTFVEKVDLGKEL